MRIAILHHSRTSVDRRNNALITYCGRFWKEYGHTVFHIDGRNEENADADILILHVNLSVVPDQYFRIAAQYPKVINSGVINISKDTFSTLVVNAESGYNGPVIIKTRYNHGGFPEKESTVQDGLKNIKHNFRKLFLNNHWQHIEWMKKYIVLESVSMVPDAVWDNQHLVVEKFVPEKNDAGLYQVREWVFLGDSEIHYINTSKEPVIRGYNSIHREYLMEDEVPEELRETRKTLGFEYGKFDYVMHDGKPVLFDINKTPGTASNMKNRPGVNEIIREFSRGIDYFIKQVS